MKNRSLNFKVGSIVLILIIGSIGIATMGLSKLHHMDDMVHEMLDESVTRTLLAKDVRSMIDAQAIKQRDVMLAESPEEIADAVKSIESRHVDILSKIQEFLKVPNTPEADLKEMQLIQNQYLEWYKVDHQIVAMISDGKSHEARVFSKQNSLPLRQKVDSELEEIVHHQNEALNADKQMADADYQEAKKWMLIFSGVSIFLGVVLAALILRALSKLLSEVILDLNGGSDQVTEASQQIAEASVQLSHASTEQASSLEETVAAIEELTGMVKINADHAQKASGLAAHAKNIAAQGDQKIHVLMSSMKDIASDSKKIEEIIAVIEGIAFQTNLLALNAAVEAARAGEQGKGFAVVAEAVRTLSQRTTAASKDISQLIRASVEKVSQGEGQAEESGKVLEEVMRAIEQVAALNVEMAAANAEQSQGISQISQAMNQLDQATQINAATSEETAASAEELSAQALQMRKVVQLLIRVVHGGSEKVLAGNSGPHPAKVFQFKPKKMSDFESPQSSGRHQA
ncbi:hypothetical protein AZI86_16125 [Bdellovibrio bacteriovorus]|uniref:Methyl-accepting transducer domain-containing protein n=1 Tax=Bdellovibrio bacteriovorus TaxID=959 RepID=A0A150WGQ0_BDEBC|nr:methyl-accepting chemotaxis protein [Bdellovibrio bacteriovorus]KYG62363.1 hypothetical protein AZI86_16125 [Bdellovibrio bacteriovorus]